MSQSWDVQVEEPAHSVASLTAGLSLATRSLTGNETKEGQEAVNEAPYRQPAGNLANEKLS